MTLATEGLRTGAAALLVLWAGACVAEVDDAQRWLQRVSEAANTLNYDGTFVYSNGEWMESMRIIHRAGPDGSQARLISLTGEAREVIRDANRVTCILPDSESVLVSKSKPRSVPAFSVFSPSGQFAAHYELATSPGERVAGRSTRLVTIVPRDEYRYGYRLSVDERSGLLLKSELVGPSGMLLEQIIYTTISMPQTIPDELLRPGVSGEGFTWYTSDAPGPEPEESQWTVAWVPEGFQMSDRASDPAGAGRMPLEHLVYTDGLASVSVFIEHLDTNNVPQEGLSSMGVVNAYGRMVDGFQVTAVGEVPAATVERVGRSVGQR